MALYRLERTDEFGWNQYTAFVVRAGSEEEARKVARDSVGQGYWADEQYVECEEIHAGGESKVILSDAIWG